MTKSMVTERLVEESDCEPIKLEGGDIEVVDKFPYLGSLVDNSGRSVVDVERRMVQASRFKSVWSSEESHLS